MFVEMERKEEEKHPEPECIGEENTRNNESRKNKEEFLKC